MNLLDHYKTKNPRSQVSNTGYWTTLYCFKQAFGARAGIAIYLKTIVL